MPTVDARLSLRFSGNRVVGLLIRDLDLFSRNFFNRVHVLRDEYGNSSVVFRNTRCPMTTPSLSAGGASRRSARSARAVVVPLAIETDAIPMSRLAPASGMSVV